MKIIGQNQQDQIVEKAILGQTQQDQLDRRGLEADFGSIPATWRYLEAYNYESNLAELKGMEAYIGSNSAKAKSIGTILGQILPDQGVSRPVLDLI